MAFSHLLVTASHGGHHRGKTLTSFIGSPNTGNAAFYAGFSDGITRIVLAQTPVVPEPSTLPLRGSDLVVLDLSPVCLG
jgi:hypothetical protein